MGYSRVEEMIPDLGVIDCPQGDLNRRRDLRGAISARERLSSTCVAKAKTFAQGKVQPAA